MSTLQVGARGVCFGGKEKNGPFSLIVWVINASRDGSPCLGFSLEGPKTKDPGIDSEVELTVVGLKDIDALHRYLGMVLDHARQGLLT